MQIARPDFERMVDSKDFLLPRRIMCLWVGHFANLEGNGTAILRENCASTKTRGIAGYLERRCIIAEVRQRQNRSVN